jgi:ParB family chromosome partitioning protein
VGSGGVPDADCAAEVEAEPEPAEEDEGVRPIPDRLVTELTAHRTLALRDALAQDPDTAFVAALHALCLKVFYRYALDSCLEIEPKSAMFASQAPGLADTASAQAIDARHAAWTAPLPKEPGALWDVLLALDHDSRQSLFAHCVGLTVNAVSDTYNRRPRAVAHADRLAQAVALDMAAVGWRPTVDNYLGRVTKGRIIEAVREASGDTTAERIRPLKKAEMATAAEDLLSGSGWLPEPLRTPGQTFAPGVEPDPAFDTAGEAQSADDGGEPALDQSCAGDDASEPSVAAAAVAAE